MNAAVRTDSPAAIRPRVLLHVFPSFGIGGVPVRTVQIANWFGNMYRHQIVALDADYECCRRFDDTTGHVRVPFVATRRSLLGRLLAFRRQMAELAPDLLITYNWGAVEMALANVFPGRRHIHVEDGFGPDEADCQLRRRVLFRRYALARTEKIIVPSRALYDIAVGTWRIPRGRVQYLPNGIDCRKFYRQPDQRLLSRIGIPQGTSVIGTVAALRAEKNLARLVRAFSRVVARFPAILVIAGDGAERAKLESLVRELGLARSVLFAGHVAQPELLLGAFDLFALSSDTEQMPYSILEAMAAGLPIASVNAGDVRQMVCAENQPFIVARNDDALADAMISLLQNARLRRQLGILNRRRARQQFDQRQMLDAYQQLFSGRDPSPVTFSPSQANPSCAELQESLI
ncbi:MAG TPA: glycosyltransferase family 4 protein [Planctomycetaceae bacterium]|jgi:glycosyltransferase involved in cell wall biosynthesis